MQIALLLARLNAFIGMAHKLNIPQVEGILQAVTQDGHLVGHLLQAIGQALTQTNPATPPPPPA